MKLHHLLDMALTDLAVLEHDPAYAVNMGFWVFDATPCLVCLAGAYLVRHHNIRTTVGLDRTLARYAAAIDFLRTGNVMQAMVRLGGSNAETADRLNREIPGYNEPNWWSEMHRLLNDLKENDL